RGRARRSRPGGGPPEAAGGDGGSSPARGGSGGPTGRLERVPFPGSGSWVEASPFYFLRVPAAGGPTRRPPDAIIPSMPLQNILAAAAISLLGLAPAPPQPGNVYRIEMAGGQIAWAQDQPRDTGTALLFHRHPDGLLVSLKKT